jgi:hypothetical protein
LLLYSSHLPLGVPNGLVIHHATSNRRTSPRQCKLFSSSGVLAEEVNDTVIILIPKKNNPEELKDFHLISLCNVVFKIISKCLVNRLRPLLQDIISPVQSAFIRQAWWLLQFPNSLCACLLKAKYYPAGHLLNRAFIQDVSVSWQGVVHGLELLKQGTIWHIGSGSMVKIWRDNWVPGADNLKISGMKKRCRLKWVSQLIDPVTRSWDEAII